MVSFKTKIYFLQPILYSRFRYLSYFRSGEQPILLIILDFVCAASKSRAETLKQNSKWSTAPVNLRLIFKWRICQLPKRSSSRLGSFSRQIPNGYSRPFSWQVSAHTLTLRSIEIILCWMHNEQSVTSQKKLDKAVVNIEIRTKSNC